MIDPTLDDRCLHNQMVKRTSRANVDKNTMGDERIPILDLKKIAALPKRKIREQYQEVVDQFI
ncbi:hypothetical protein [Tunturiibacter gelidiferens]|uniref:hypothetical protein n=1 Tax=Tunturiibacter gelidiferens TaxID=3069689 RepID=UPI003D9BDEC1